MSQLNLYTSEDGQAQVQLRAEQGTVWLTQLEMAELFLATKESFAKHLKAIFTEKELSEAAVVNHWLTTAADGNLSEIPTGSQNPKQWRPCHG